MEMPARANQLQNNLARANQSFYVKHSGTRNAAINVSGVTGSQQKMMMVSV